MDRDLKRIDGADGRPGPGVGAVAPMSGEGAIMPDVAAILKRAAVVLEKNPRPTDSPPVTILSVRSFSPVVNTVS
jgi:hypothetical protein